VATRCRRDSGVVEGIYGQRYVFELGAATQASRNRRHRDSLSDALSYVAAAIRRCNLLFRCVFAPTTTTSDSQPHRPPPKPPSTLRETAAPCRAGNRVERTCLVTPAPLKSPPRNALVVGVPRPPGARAGAALERGSDAPPRMARPPRAAAGAEMANDIVLVVGMRRYVRRVVRVNGLQREGPNRAWSR